MWLQYYVKDWSIPHNASFSQKHGLKIRPSSFNLNDMGVYARYLQMDGDLVHVNQLLKYIKFGFGQCTDMASYDIRARRITRDQGIKLVHEYDGKCGEQFIKNFCDHIEISTEEFWKTANSFRGVMWRKENEEWKLINPIWEQFPQALNSTISDNLFDIISTGKQL